MSNRNKGGRNLSVVISFCVLILAAVLWLILGLDRWISMPNEVVNILRLIVNIGLIVAIAMAAFPFVKGRKGLMWILFWVIVIVALAGAIFSGVTPMF